jgi:hypothetical protein
MNDIVKQAEAVVCLLKKSEFEDLPPHLANALIMTLNNMLNWHRTHYANSAYPETKGRFAWCEACQELKMRQHTCRLNDGTTTQDSG